jgi:hypothetical protein
MDGELSTTSLSESFQKVLEKDSTSNSLDSDSDIQGNMLKYLLESHASQTSASGPASNFLAMLGLKLPSVAANVDSAPLS